MKRNERYFGPSSPPFQYFQRWLSPGHSLLLPSRQAGRLLELRRRTQMATGKCLLNADRADAVLAKRQVPARAKQEQEPQPLRLGRVRKKIALRASGCESLEPPGLICNPQ